MENMDKQTDETIETPEAAPEIEVTEIDIIETVVEPAAPEANRPIVRIADWAAANKLLLMIAAGVIVVFAALWFFRGCFVAATVNGEPVNRSAVINELERSSGKAALDSLIKERLVKQEAAKQGIVISEQDVDAKLKEAEDGLAAQGVTLDQALADQGLSRDIVRGRIATQLKLEKMLGDKVAVSNEEVEKYIKDNAITFPEDQKDSGKESLKDAMRTSKLNEEADAFVTDLMNKANIEYWVKY